MNTSGHKSIKWATLLAKYQTTDRSLRPEKSRSIAQYTNAEELGERVDSHTEPSKSAFMSALIFQECMCTHSMIDPPPPIRNLQSATHN